MILWKRLSCLSSCLALSYCVSSRNMVCLFLSVHSSTIDSFFRIRAFLFCYFPFFLWFFEPHPPFFVVWMCLLL
ncbi:hypothetical protein V8B55DRAFT_1538999, partial [Mucor lusitanicus]